MADQADTDQANDQYAALERLYSNRRWAELEASAEVLIAEMDGAVAGQWDGDGDLRARVQLLLGHTRLYGFNDAGIAAEHYRQVLAAQPQALLLGIAQEGLNQCLATEQPSASDAMPWLEQTALTVVAAQELQPSFPGFASPVETFESLESSESPTEIVESTDQIIQETQTQLSPKESAELAKGLLSVVIRPN